MTKAIITSPSCRLILEDKFGMAEAVLLRHILVRHQLLRTSGRFNLIDLIKITKDFDNSQEFPRIAVSRVDLDHKLSPAIEGQSNNHNEQILPKKRLNFSRN